MPGTQLYTPGIHRADTRRILEPILFCQAIEIKDPTSLFFEDVPLSFSAYNAPLEVPSHPSNRSGYLQMCRYSVDPCIVELGTSSGNAALNETSP